MLFFASSTCFIYFIEYCLFSCMRAALQVITETGGVFLKEVWNYGKAKILSSNESARERDLAYAG
jgi:hypothetical protein